MSVKHSTLNKLDLTKSSNYFPERTSARIAVAMSGGVDSSVALCVLKNAGYDVVGITAWIVAGEGRCCDNGVVDAAKVCEQLDVEHHAIDLRENFSKQIISEFHNAYAQGQTPIPCISCNNDVKWGSLLAYSIEKLGATHLASGHYAKLHRNKNNFSLFKPKETHKDQSYMLWGLTQKQLAHTVFPLADFTKEEVRAIAHEANLCVADKAESQDICFVSNGMTNSEYLTRILGEKPGDIIDYQTGKIIGQHTGSYNFTYGQRKGIGIAHQKPLYVVKIDAKNNQVFVGTKELLEGQIAFGKDVNFFNKPNNAIFEALVKIRYNSEPSLAKVTIIDDNNLKAEFLEPVTAITPGQALVLFDAKEGKEVIGGAWISEYEQRPNIA